MLKKIYLTILPIFLFLMILYPTVINKYGYFPFDIIFKEIAELEPPRFDDYLFAFRDLFKSIVNFTANIELPNFSDVNSIFDIPILVNHIASYGFIIGRFLINILGGFLNIIIATIKLMINLFNYPLDIISKLIFIFS